MTSLSAGARFRLAVREETPLQVVGTKPTLDVLKDLFEKSNYDLRKLLVGLTRTRSFTHRSLSTGEAMP